MDSFGYTPGQWGAECRVIYILDHEALRDRLLTPYSKQNDGKRDAALWNGDSLVRPSSMKGCVRDYENVSKMRGECRRVTLLR